MILIEVLSTSSKDVLQHLNNKLIKEIDDETHKATSLRTRKDKR